MDQAGVAQIAADVLGAEPDSELLKMAERPAGNPFLLVELLSGLREEGLVRVESGRAELVEWRLPESGQSQHAPAAGAHVRIGPSGSYGRRSSGAEVFP